MDIKEKLDDFLKDKYNIIFLVLLIIGIILRFRYFGIDSVWPDEGFYAYRGLQVFKNPLFLFSREMAQVVAYVPVAVISFFNIFFDKYTAAKLMPLFFSVIGLALTYFIGSKIKDKFTGLLAMGFLTFSSLYLFIGSRVLVDVPLATMFLLVIFCLLKYEEKKETKWAIALGASTALTVYTRISGLLIVLILLLYFLFAYKKDLIKKFKDKSFQKVILVFIALTLPFLVINFAHFGNFIPFSPGEFAQSYIFSGGVDFYFVHLASLLTWFLIPLFVIGLVFLALNLKDKKYILLLVWLIVYFGVFTFIIQEKVARYILPVLPAIYIVAAYGISKIRINKNATYLLIILAIGVMFLLYQSGDALMLSKANSYIGLQEAGIWITANVPADSLIYSGSHRAIRFFSERDHADDGGTLHTLSNDLTWDVFLNETQGQDAYLLTDSWEYLQPEWAYPLNEEKFNAISTEFTLIHVIRKGENPVVLIFHRSP